MALSCPRKHFWKKIKSNLRLTKILRYHFSTYRKNILGHWMKVVQSEPSHKVCTPSHKVHTLSHKINTISHKVRTSSNKIHTISHKVRNISHKVRTLSHKVCTISHKVCTLSHKVHTHSHNSGWTGEPMEPNGSKWTKRFKLAHYFASILGHVLVTMPIPTQSF